MLLQPRAPDTENGCKPVRPYQPPVRGAQQLKPGSAMMVEAIGVRPYLIVLPRIRDNQLDPIGCALRNLHTGGIADICRFHHEGLLGGRQGYLVSLDGGPHLHAACSSTDQAERIRRSERKPPEQP